jgi:hypothetical protein
LETLIDQEQKDIDRLELETKGINIYYSAFAEIESIGNSDRCEIPESIIQEKEVLYDCTRNILLNSEEIPPAGINAEILFYIALKDKVEIRPSTLREDYLEHFDFLINGERVDVTSNIHNPNIFKRKWTHAHPPTLFIPSSPVRNYRYLGDFIGYPDYTKTYTYQLLFENNFDIDRFLRETLYINYEMLNILKDCFNKREYNKFHIQEKYIGNITQDAINNQKRILKMLSEQLNIHIINC